MLLSFDLIVFGLSLVNFFFMVFETPMSVLCWNNTELIKLCIAYAVGLEFIFIFIQCRM